MMNGRIKWKIVPESEEFASRKKYNWGFPSSPAGKESACNAGDAGLIPGSGRSPGEGCGNPFQYSYLENSMDRGHWSATVHGVAKGRI